MIDLKDKNISLEKRKTELIRMVFEIWNKDECGYKWNDLVSMNELIQNMEFEEDFQALFGLITLANKDGYNCGYREAEDWYLFVDSH